MAEGGLGLNARILNDFFHDLSAGVFPGAVTAAWVIRRAMDVFEPGTGALIGQAADRLWLLLLGALGVLVWTGIVRLRYWRLNVRAGFMETRERMAVTKHIAFVIAQLAAAVALVLL